MWKQAKCEKVPATISSAEIYIMCYLDKKTDSIHNDNEKARPICTKILRFPRGEIE